MGINFEIFLSGEGLITLEILMFKKHDGKVCNKCGFIQGSYDKGFDNYYCIHVRNKVQKRLKSLTERALRCDIEEAIDMIKKEFV